MKLNNKCCNVCVSLSIPRTCMWDGDCPCHKPHWQDLSKEENNPFEKIVSRMCSEFPIDKVDWNKRVAPYLREFQQLIDNARQEGKNEILGGGRMKHFMETELAQAKQEGYNEGIKKNLADGFALGKELDKKETDIRTRTLD